MRIRDVYCAVYEGPSADGFACRIWPDAADRRAIVFMACPQHVVTVPAPRVFDFGKALVAHYGLPAEQVGPWCVSAQVDGFSDEQALRVHAYVDGAFVCMTRLRANLIGIAQRAPENRRPLDEHERVHFAEALAYLAGDDSEFGANFRARYEVARVRAELYGVDPTTELVREFDAPEVRANLRIRDPLCTARAIALLFEGGAEVATA